MVTRRDFLVAGAAFASMGTTPFALANSARPGSEIVMMDATALATAIRTRSVSCVEVMNAYLDQVERLNPKVNAIVALQDRAALLAEAEARDLQGARGEWMGPLHGLPHAVKDLAALKGFRFTRGSPIYKDAVATNDAEMVARLRKAGVVFIGKTNTPEFGLGSHTYNNVYGTTLNAYDQARSAGGSSGGAAVGLALRMLPLADGSDFGGSLRNPAGWNNVFGFRTTIGLVPTEGRDVWAPTMGVAGPMARTVTDLAMLLEVQAGNDPRAPYSVRDKKISYVGQLDADMRGKRVGWLGDFSGATANEPEVMEVCKAALKSFETVGCVVEEAVPDYPAEKAWRAYMQLRHIQQGGGILAEYKDADKRALLKPEAIWEIENGLKLSAFDVQAASVIRAEWCMSFRKLYEHFDFLLVPSAQLFPFDAQIHWPKEINGRQMETYHEWSKAVSLITLLGGPALAVPAGFSARGLPIGLQIVGPLHQELECLQLARAYERVNDWIAKRKPALLA